MVGTSSRAPVTHLNPCLWRVLAELLFVRAPWSVAHRNHAGGSVQDQGLGSGNSQLERGGAPRSAAGTWAITNDNVILVHSYSIGT